MTFKQARKYGAVVGAGSLALVQQAHAEVPASVLTSITGAVTDVGIIGAAILGVVIVIATYAWLRRPIK